MAIVVLRSSMILPTVSHLAMGTMAEHVAPFSELLAGVVRVVTMGSVMGMSSASVFWLLTFATIDV